MITSRTWLIASSPLQFSNKVYTIFFSFTDKKNTFTRIYYFINLFELQAKQQLRLEQQGFIFSRF